MVATVRKTILAMGQDIRVYAVQPLNVYVDESFTDARWMARTMSAFGVLALTLAAIGLYGVIAYRVSLRTRELGVRMALGAERRDIFRDVIVGGLMIVLIGVIIGEALAIPLMRALAALQPGIRPGISPAHVGAAIIWVAVAVAACYVPASRAARVDPMAALRQE